MRAHLLRVVLAERGTSLSLSNTRTDSTTIWFAHLLPDHGVPQELRFAQFSFLRSCLGEFVRPVAIMASSWRALGAVAPVQYRRHEVWPMAWSSSDEGDDTGAADASSAAGPLHTSVVVGAAFGGPIATMCNPRLMVSVRGAPPTTGKAGTIELHSSSGVHMRSLPLTEEWRSQTVVKMGWTMEERLVVVFASGLALMFSVHSAEVVAQFNVVPQGSAELQDVVIWPHGLVAMTSAFQLVYVSNLDYYAAQAMARASIVEGAEAAQAAATEGSRDLPTLVLPSLRFTGSATPTSIAVVQSPQGDEVRDARIAKGKPPPIRVLVATSDCTVLFVDCAGCEDKELREQLTEGGPINMMVLTPNGKYIACFSANGVLSVWSSDFATRVMENPIKTTQAPRQIVWCGGDSVILHWVPVGLLMVGPSAECVAASSPAVGAALLVLRCWGAALLGRCWRRPMRRCCPGASAAHRLTASPRPVCAPRPAPRALRSRRARYLKYSFDRQPLHLVQELDCVRVISNSACVILQRVPPEIEQIRGLGSTVPAAMLFDAHDAFVAGEARADDSIRAVAGDADATVLPRAIETCLAAALAEFSLRAQTELLNAGAFGKCFLEDGDSLNVESRRIADVLRATTACRRWRELAGAGSVWQAKAEREGILDKAAAFEVESPAALDGAGGGGGGAGGSASGHEEGVGAWLAFYARVFAQEVRAALPPRLLHLFASPRLATRAPTRCCRPPLCTGVQDAGRGH